MNQLSSAPKSQSWWFSFYLFAAVAMCYGWGWRGVYGHSVGAMLPGALVAMAICLGSGRPDWYRRSVIAGLAGAIGWAWGGQISNMEHRQYIMSNTEIDAIYGFACIGFLGALWSGIGGATLAMVFTRSRAELNRYIGPLIVLGIAFTAVDIVLAYNLQLRADYYLFTEDNLNDTKWLFVAVTLAVLLPYWAIRPKDSPATGLMIQCAIGWFVGYLCLTKFGGLELAPPYRSESWSGVLGILIVLILHHILRKDRAALMFTQYAMLAGCIGFIIALQIHVPFATAWGPFADLSSWKFAEESFGFCMGFGVALGAGRLLRGGIAPAVEDANRDPLDIFAAFVLLIVMFWLNLPINLQRWDARHHVLPKEPLAPFKEPFPQLEPWLFFLIAGIFWTGIALYGLKLYHKRRLAMTPRTPFEKGALVFALIFAVSLFAVITLGAPEFADPSSFFTSWGFLMLTGLAMWMLFARSAEGLSAHEPAAPGTSPEDDRWSVGWKYWALWAWVPLHVYLAGLLACHIVDRPWRQEGGRERHRFGPNATWRLEEEGKGGDLWKP